MSARTRKSLFQFRNDDSYHFLGYFLDEIEAAKAYDRAILPLAGIIALLDRRAAEYRQFLSLCSACAGLIDAWH